MTLYTTLVNASRLNLAKLEQHLVARPPRSELDTYLDATYSEAGQDA